MKHCFIVSHVAIAGNTVVEPYCFIGMNATIRNSIWIAREYVIGAGSVILHNTNEKEVYAARSTIKLEIASDQLRDLWWFYTAVEIVFNFAVHGKSGNTQLAKY